MDYLKQDAMLHRCYELGDKDFVDLYVWQPFEEDECRWACPYLIEGLYNDKLRNSYGVDSCQALMMSLQMASVQLYASEPYQEGHLTWLGSRDLGLPMVAGIDARNGELTQAQLLTTAGQSAIIAIPGRPLPYLAFPEERLARLTEQLRAIDARHPETGLEAIMMGLERELNWYKANND